MEYQCSFRQPRIAFQGEFYRRARTISVDLNNAKFEATSFQEGVKGVLRVALRVSTGTAVIVPALSTFLKQYPELSLGITLTDQKLDLVANNLDAAVWMGQLPNSDLVAKRLSLSQRVVCGSPKYIGANTYRHPRGAKRLGCRGAAFPSAVSPCVKGQMPLLTSPTRWADQPRACLHASPSPPL